MNWTPEEIEYLQNNYGRVPIGEISDRLERSPASINAFANNIKCDWSPRNIKFLKKHIYEMPVGKIARALNLPTDDVVKKATELGLISRRFWTSEDKEYLASVWGKKSLKYICKYFKSTQDAVRIQEIKLKVGFSREANPDYVTLNYLMCNVFPSSPGKRAGHSYTIELLKSKGLQVKMMPMPTVEIACVNLKHFWQFAEQNRGMIDFSRLEKWALGPEPDWVEEQRKNDYKLRTLVKPKNTVWTPHEDSMLALYGSQKKYTTRELAKVFKRSDGAIIRRLSDLGIHKGVIKEKARHFDRAELDRFAEYIKQGLKYPLIAEKLGRSEKSLRGIICQRFGSENIDAARQRLLNGEILEEKRRTAPNANKRNNHEDT